MHATHSTAFILSILGSALCAGAAEVVPLYEAEFVFDPDAADHGHVHASCVVECPNGDIRVCWYENGPTMPPPYFSEQRDKSDDVRIGGNRKPAGGAWETPFVIAATFGCSDNNPCMVVDAEDRLWLVYPTLLGVPENTWGSALVRYHISTDYDKPGPPAWEYVSILVPKLDGLEVPLINRINDRADAISLSDDSRRKTIEIQTKRLEDPLKRRLGWMPRSHPLVRSDGTLILPLANENLSVAAMALTSDGGRTWTYSTPVPDAGVIQPTVVEWPDKRLTAFFRSADDEPHVQRSESDDGGLTWSRLTKTSLVHPGSGLDAIVLDNGHLAIVHNDKIEDPRDRLAVSISADGGKTWPWVRHLEDIPGGRFDYPSLIQGKDGTLHTSYSYNLKTIKYVHFNEAWVQQGDDGE